MVQQILEILVALQGVKKFPAFMKPQSSLPCWQ